MSSSDLRDNQMQRGLNQALYKYLPHSWIDFYKKVDRTPYTAYVTQWNSEEIPKEELNKNRLLLRVSRTVEEFNNHGKIKDYIFPINEETYSVRTLVPGVNSDVITEVNPLTFFCGNCSKVHSYNTSENFFRYNPNRTCTACKVGTLKQLNLVYACECGWGGPVEPIGCRVHGKDHLYYNGNFSFRCKFEPHRKIEIRRKCPSCDKKKDLYTKNALDMSNYLPKSLTMIDLVDVDLDKFLETNTDGSRIVISNWLEKINKKELNKIVKNSSKNDPDDESDRLQDLIKTYMEKLQVSEEQATMIARVTLSSESNETVVNEAVDDINQSILNLNPNNLNDLAVQFLEYDTVLNPPNSYVSTLENAIKVSRKLNTNANPEQFEQLSKKFGFKHVQASGDIPFIMASYGYTRKETDPGKATLVGFPAERKKKNIYAAKMSTEGILFELDRAAIIKWLHKNNIISEQSVPDLTNETELKKWFINHINPGAITTFSQINENTDKITYYVYNLIHSISHSLLKQSANLCGLDKNSLSEYIFPNVPGILIYCQNSQGLNIGAMFNIFEAYFDKWLESTKSAVEKCIFDPICIDRDHACSGCLYLNEVSCVHFNKDLDRRFLLGHYDRTTDDRFYGYWEDI
ncbi:hypothetical protein [Bacillus pinisoli]|uniref:hypothetical protein n=1 Tax=Bacillus pinisoli TaxID=2901866 RepID=UPI001FF5DE62|nr:hypothetical protein [Bacillus pinisoli]